MSAAPSRRQRIIQWVGQALLGIRTDAGADTDAGAALYVGALPVLGPDDPAVALALIVGDDEARWQGKKLFLRLPLHISVVARGVSMTAWTLVEQALGDIKRAIEVEDRTLGGLVHNRLERGTTTTLPREAGSELSGLTITYVASMCEAWGQPES